MHTTSLCFLAFAPMLARALPPERASAPERPPSSLEPSVKHRVVSVAHRHQRVKSCTDAARAAPACRPVLEDADSATAVTLRRLGKVPNTADNPSAVVVSFETRKGRQEQSVELALGAWVVDWPGHRFLTRLDVTADNAPSVFLQTTSGRCEVDGAVCRLATDAVSKRITVGETPP